MSTATAAAGVGKDPMFPQRQRSTRRKPRCNCSQPETWAPPDAPVNAVRANLREHGITMAMEIAVARTIATLTSWLPTEVEFQTLAGGR